MAAITLSELALVADGGPQSCCLSVRVRASLPGSPAQSVHRVVSATACAAWVASHSSGDNTATRLPLLTTVAVGNCSLSSSPTEVNVDPNVGGRTIRACNM